MSFGSGFFASGGGGGGGVTDHGALTGLGDDDHVGAGMMKRVASDPSLYGDAGDNRSMFVSAEYIKVHDGNGWLQAMIVPLPVA